VTNVLILSAAASAINCIKSLTRDAALRVFVTDSSRHACGLYLDGVTPLVIPRARDLDGYRAALDDIIRRHAIDVMLPTSDRDVEGVLSLLQAGWRPGTKLFHPPSPAFRILGYKNRLMEHLAGSEIPIPRSYAYGDDHGFPVVVKPVSEGGTKGVTIAGDRLQLESAVTQLRQTYGNDFVIQEYIPGGTGSIHMVTMLYDHSGELVSAVVMRSSLTFMTWGGGGNAGAIVDEPEPVRLAQSAVKLAGGWHGPVCLEFKQHAGNRRFYLMEANCRLNGYSYLTTMNGIDFPRAIVDLLVYERTERLPRSPQSGEKNFILGFREKVIARWADEPPTGESGQAQGPVLRTRRV
jgi:predicted ATP-grasp superfamily ATP-dependent carboligase